MNLDESERFDPLVLYLLRVHYQANIPVFCFAGEQEMRDELRRLRADWFFSRDNFLRRLPEFIAQYDW